MNVLTYGGARCWGTQHAKGETFTAPALDDNKLEVVGIKGVAHLGAVQTGMASGKRIAQGATVTITLHNALPSQVDGEPCHLPPCQIAFTHFNQACMLRHVSSRV